MHGVSRRQSVACQLHARMQASRQHCREAKVEHEAFGRAHPRLVLPTHLLQPAPQVVVNVKQVAEDAAVAVQPKADKVVVLHMFGCVHVHTLACRRVHS